MKRPVVSVTITGEDGSALAGETRQAWNSGVRASERLVAEHARQVGCVYEGDRPVVSGGRPGQPGAVYRRRWVPQGQAGGVVATVSVDATWGLS